SPDVRPPAGSRCYVSPLAATGECGLIHAPLHSCTPVEVPAANLSRTVSIPTLWVSNSKYRPRFEPAPGRKTMYDATIVVLRWGGGRVGVPIKRSACAAPVTLTRA